MKYAGIPYKSINIVNFPEYFVNLNALINIIWHNAIIMPEYNNAPKNTSY
jgi:hypothetical protein